MPDVRLRSGVIGLDRYKNWILHWDADAAKTFPRAFMTTAQAKRLKDTITTQPGGRYRLRPAVDR